MPVDEPVLTIALGFAVVLRAPYWFAASLYLPASSDTVHSQEPQGEQGWKAAGDL